MALESHLQVTVGRMVASGTGAARCRLCKTQMASLGAVCIPLSDPPIEKCVGAIHAGHLPLSKAAQALLDTLKGFYPPEGGQQNRPAGRFDNQICRRRRSRRRQRSPWVFFCPFFQTLRVALFRFIRAAEDQLSRSISISYLSLLVLNQGQVGHNRQRM